MYNDSPVDDTLLRKLSTETQLVGKQVIIKGWADEPESQSVISNVIIFLTYQLISTGWIQVYCAGGSLVFSFVLYANFLVLFNRNPQPATVKEENKYK